MLGGGAGRLLARLGAADDLDEDAQGRRIDEWTDGDGEGDGLGKTDVLIGSQTISLSHLVALSCTLSLALAEPNADGRSGLSWPFVCFGVRCC
jgi:hypothetical protein